MGEIRQTNFRIDQETADVFRKFCEDNGLNQAQGFDHIMQVVEMDRAKSAVPERLVEIEAFEKCTKDLINAYLNSLEICKSTEERVREQFASALERQDKTISDLQSKTDELRDAKASAEQTAASAAQAAAQAIKEEEAARKQADTATKLATEKDRTISTLADKLSIAEEKAAGFDELKRSEEQAQATIADLKKDIEVLNAESARKLAAAKADFNREIESLKKEHAREISDLKKDHETVIREFTTDMERKVSDAKKDAALLLAQAVAEKEREMMGQLREAEKNATTALAQAVSDKEHEMNEQLRTSEKENIKLQAKIEALEARISELTATKATKN